MQLEWQGHYLDGRTAARQKATIHLMGSGLQVTVEGGKSFCWPYEEIRQTQGFYPGEQIRLERGGEIPEAILVSDETFLASLRRYVPKLTKHFHDLAWRRRRAQLIVVASVAMVGVVTALYLWGIPAMATIVASRVPVSWEERLGESVVNHLAPKETRCQDPTQGRAIEEIITTLTAPLDRSPYTFKAIVVDDPTLNALAAPGGYIVIFRGLLEQTQTPEELAGVLAHELQHILKRHATRALLEHASIGILFAALVGDVSGTASFGLETARTLGLLRYSRRSEEEADAEGIRMLLAAGIDPAGMIAFFETMRKKSSEGAAFPAYLSTHPGTEERIEKLRATAQRPRQKSIRLLPDYNWKDVKKICSATGKTGKGKEAG